MKLTKLTVEDASTVAVAALGLDTDAIDLSSPEGLATSLRRAASFMCPTSPGRLVDAVLGALKPLHGDELKRDDLVDLLDHLVASGDLLELRQESGRWTRLLYLGPPSYIERVPGIYLLMGVRPFGAPLIGDELAEAIEYEGHTRTLTADSDGELRSRGLHRVSMDSWVSSPSPERAAEFIGRHRARLDVAAEGGQLDGLLLLDPSSEVRYYRGRWRPPCPTDTGDFVARRPQAYGADLWCLVRFRAGESQRLIDFPVNDPVVPGRDEAWRYQAAVDSLRGAAQQFRLRRGFGSSACLTIDFFSPLPAFAERYVQLVGLALRKTPGTLFSFRLPAEAVGDVRAFLADMLWMTETEDSSGD
ncbi:hypothetical protein SAMN05443377_12534 [Propionibacterium cyclohexanicum]|mgnify:CR=1 FL=1|uniref:Uncharacterized protein n=1 Tax=Propionibacterium cyclohexanicum TaxID=64702 RepID=A0A1H9TPE0_9ACTN|nr:hypothetical protein [Propionibacterium cyclohexanicum]SER98503.1 hypothetical protein SAMN05443377_12534 [Propionibacterium cyclohexanicum]